MRSWRVKKVSSMSRTNSSSTGNSSGCCSMITVLPPAFVSSKMRFKFLVLSGSQEINYWRMQRTSSWSVDFVILWKTQSFIFSVKWLKRPMKTEFFGLYSFPFMTSVINLWEPWITYNLHSFGFFKKIKTRTVWKRIGGEIHHQQQKIGGDQGREEWQRQRNEFWGHVFSLYSLPQGMRSRGECYLSHICIDWSRMYSPPVVTWSLGHDVVDVTVVSRGSWGCGRMVGSNNHDVITSTSVPPLQYKCHRLHCITRVNVILSYLVP